MSLAEKRPERANVFGDQGPAGRCALCHVELPLAVASTDKAVDTRGLFKCIPVFFSIGDQGISLCAYAHRHVRMLAQITCLTPKPEP
jgi:hypothetical protein